MNTLAILETTSGQCLESLIGKTRADYLFRLLFVDPALMADNSDEQFLSRAQIALLLNMLLFEDLLQRVPDANDYARDQIDIGRKIIFDHGALRSVATTMQRLPSGQQAFARILQPLGFCLAGRYPLDKLNMCGFVYTHEDYAETIGQFFVSELYPERFSAEFQRRVNELVFDSSDPLTTQSQSSLAALLRHHKLETTAAMDLLPNLLACFQRQHRSPTLEEYQCFKQESREMAWIATEGNVFNHATDRVSNIQSVDQIQRKKGRPMKPDIETGRHANIRQTAYQATTVERPLLSNGEERLYPVPGSFFEFIQRGTIKDEEGNLRLDLRFDSANAQGIFKVTR